MRRHGLMRRGDNRPWRRCGCLGPQILVGSLGDKACYLLLARLELLNGLCIVAGQLSLARLELRDPLPHVCEIARHRLEQLRQLGRHWGGCRRDVLRCGLSQRCWLWGYWLRGGHLKGRRARLRRNELRRPPGENLLGRIAIGRLRNESSDKDAPCQQQADEAT